MEYTFKARLFHRHVTSISAQLLHAPLASKKVEVAQSGRDEMINHL